MGLFGKKEKQKTIKPINLTFVDGVKGYVKGTLVSLRLDDTSNCVVMESIRKTFPKVNLDFEKVIAVDVVHEKDIIETNKSTVGRAMVGGVLLGPLGAVIGGISGTGTKKSSRLRNFLVINYKTIDGETKVISFEIENITLSTPKFINKLREKISNNKIDEIYL